jgi:hypothetical protein
MSAPLLCIVSGSGGVSCSSILCIFRGRFARRSLNGRRASLSVLFVAESCDAYTFRAVVSGSPDGVSKIKPKANRPIDLCLVQLPTPTHSSEAKGFGVGRQVGRIAGPQIGAGDYLLDWSSGPRISNSLSKHTFAPTRQPFYAC